ncbi:MAG: histidinol-phosphate aminotransferase family protein, partial [Actinomycetia bacterium]|nr:histidinol-phosphate aminotransferase family protein [Actinomycetes bacterium]
VVRFDHNTSPFTTDWAAGMVAPMARTLNEYPGASYAPLRVAAASFLGTAPENIVPGAGIDELILLIAKAFITPGARAATAVPTYPLYEIASSHNGGEFIGVPYGAQLTFPSEEVSRVSETAEIVWLCVPNNPTGDRVPDEAISNILSRAKGIVVIDAAYAEFTGDSWARWVERYSNLVVIHTMSKAFGLAGLRVGFAMGQPVLIDAIDAVRPPGSIASVSAEIAEIALREPKRMHRAVQRIVEEREHLAAALLGLGFTVMASTTNFVLCHVGPHARNLAERILGEGIVVRTYGADHRLGEFLRFTVRSPSDDRRLVDTMMRHLSSSVADAAP